jgi:glycosyltransferase involved in cell wall biosynthesis
MKVVHVNTYCTGGAAKACRRIVGALNGSGTEAKMLVLYKTNDDADIIDFRDEYGLIRNYQLKFANKLFVMNHERKFGNREELFSSYEPVWKVEDHSLIKTADVVHLHWVSGFLNFPSFFNPTRKKIVFTMHDYFPFSGGYHYPNPYLESEKFKQEVKANLELITKLYKESKIHFVGPSQYIIDRFTKVMGTGFKTSVIKNPVDSKVFFKKDASELRSKLGLTKEDKVLMFINEKEGYKRKGCEILIQMLPEILKMGYKIILAGERTTRINDPAVKQIGYINSDAELSQCYNAADLFVCTSLDDNLPNVISESHCAGTPVIAFATGGIPEMIEEGKNGFLIPKFDTQKYLNTLKEFLKTDLNRNEISSKALSVYSSSEAAKKYNDIYLNG